MATPLVIYIDDYATEEQVALNRFGVRTTRVAMEPSNLHTLGIGGTVALIRGPKLKPQQFEKLCSVLSGAGISSRTFPASFLALSNSDTYERSIQANVPEMRTMSITSKSLIQEISKLSDWGQVFVRSELGSAAKISGIESCLIRKFGQEEIKEKIDSLKRAHPNATKVVVRKVVDVRKVDGKSVEGRFVVLAGEVRYLDHFDPGALPLKQTFESVHLGSAALVADNLRRDGIDGDYFIDIAELEAGGWFVVEIKPLLNGSIRNTAAFAASLLRTSGGG